MSLDGKAVQQPEPSFLNENGPIKPDRSREQRLLRIDASEFSIGIRGLLLACVTLLASSALLSLAMLTKPSIQYLSNFLLYLVTLIALYLAYIAQNPFSGLDVMSSAPMQEALDRLTNMQLTRGN